MAFVTDNNGPQPLWQPPPTAYVTTSGAASGAASGAPSVLMHPWGGAAVAFGGWTPKPCGPAVAISTSQSASALGAFSSFVKSDIEGTQAWPPSALFGARRQLRDAVPEDVAAPPLALCCVAPGWGLGGGEGSWAGASCGRRAQEPWRSREDLQPLIPPTLPISVHRPRQGGGTGP